MQLVKTAAKVWVEFNIVTHLQADMSAKMDITHPATAQYTQ